jgi:hypothetical protein
MKTWTVVKIDKWTVGVDMTGQHAYDVSIDVDTITKEVLLDVLQAIVDEHNSEIQRCADRPNQAAADADSGGLR